MKKIWSLTHYYCQDMFDLKTLLLFCILFPILAGAALALSGRVDMTVSQFDMYFGVVSTAYMKYAFWLFPQIISMILCVLAAQFVSGVYKNSTDYLCLYGGNRRFDIHMSKCLAAIFGTTIVLLVYFVVAALGALVGGIYVFDAKIMLAAFRWISNGMICMLGTIFFTAIMKSIFSGFIAWGIVFAVPFLQTGVNKGLDIAVKTVKFVIPLFDFGKYTDFTMEALQKADTYFHAGWILPMLLLLFLSSFAVYRRQDI